MDYMLEKEKRSFFSIIKKKRKHDQNRVTRDFYWMVYLRDQQKKKILIDKADSFRFG